MGEDGEKNPVDPHDHWFDHRSAYSVFWGCWRERCTARSGGGRDRDCMCRHPILSCSGCCGAEQSLPQDARECTDPGHDADGPCGGAFDEPLIRRVRRRWQGPNSKRQRDNRQVWSHGCVNTPYRTHPTRGERQLKRTRCQRGTKSRRFRPETMQWWHQKDRGRERSRVEKAGTHDDDRVVAPSPSGSCGPYARLRFAFNRHPDARCGGTHRQRVAHQLPATRRTELAQQPAA